MRKSHYFIIFLCIILWPAVPARSSISLQPFGLHGDGTITLFNTHTQEFGTIKYKNGSNYLTDGLVSLNHILRCRMTDAEIGMSLKLVELIDEIEDHFGTRVEIISGYRSPALNSTLRNSGHRVAQNSLHMEGMAVDIRMPGVPLREIRDYAGRLKAGGVGYYPGQFVHVDVGEVRYW